VKLAELQVEIRPRSHGQTVAIAARMLQHRPGPLLVAWLFYSLATVALAALFLLVLEWHPFWAWLLTPLLAPVFSSPLVTTIGHLVFTPKVSFGLVAGETLRRLPAFVLLFFVNRVISVVGLCALVVPGLYLWRASWFLGPIVLLEGSPLGASFRRGRRFAAGFQGHVIAHAFNSAALLLYLGVAGASLGHFLVTKVFGLSFSAVANLTVLDAYPHLLGLGAFALAAPFVTLVWFFVYLDVRTRKEGWDLELAFRARAAELERVRA
jgi:hypothetical protein